MKPKSVLVYLVIFAALAVFYYVYEVRLGARKNLEKEAETRVFNLGLDQVRALRYGNGGREYLIEDLGPDAWIIKEPLETPADRWTVEGLIRTALDGVRQRRFTAETSRLGDYGLVRPEITLTLLGANGENLAPTLSLGEENPAQDSRYARLGGDSMEIFTVPNAFYRDLKKSLYDLRNKSLVLLPGEKIDQLRLSGSMNVVLEKRSLRSWEITSPRVGPADNDVVQRLIYAGLKGRVERFEPGDTVEGNAGFDHPLVRIEVLSEGKKAADLVVGRPLDPPQGAEGGEPSRTAWVKSSERSDIMLAGSSIVDALALEYDDLKDRHVLSINRRMLTQLKITYQGRVFRAVKENSVWRVVEPLDATSRDMDIESFLMAVEDLKYVRTIDTRDKNPAFTPDVVVEMTGLDEQVRILKIDLTRTEERYIPVRIGTGLTGLVSFDQLVPRLPVEIRPAATP